nr:hypothetical protein [Methylocystis sp. ATCC 49242]
MPVPSQDKASGSVVLVWGGCGPYGHRGPWGGCRPGGQWGGYAWRRPYYAPRPYYGPRYWAPRPYYW